MIFAQNACDFCPLAFLCIQLHTHQLHIPTYDMLKYAFKCIQPAFNVVCSIVYPVPSGEGFEGCCFAQVPATLLAACLRVRFGA